MQTNTENKQSVSRVERVGGMTEISKGHQEILDSSYIIK